MAFCFVTLCRDPAKQALTSKRLTKAKKIDIVVFKFNHNHFDNASSGRGIFQKKIWRNNIVHAFSYGGVIKPYLNLNSTTRSITKLRHTEYNISEIIIELELFKTGNLPTTTMKYLVDKRVLLQH